MGYFLTGNTDKRNSNLYVEVECSECGYKKWQRQKNVNLDKPCDRLRHSRPDLAQLLDDCEDDFQYTPFSHKTATWKCPYCNSKFKRTVATVTVRGFNCPVCGTGISFPNKMMYLILKQLNETFQREYTFTWAKDKYYDFYINDINAIIEMHGKQHYEDLGKKSGWDKSLSSIIANDSFKKDMAIKNGITDYIVIDSRISDYDYIFENVKKSSLSSYYDLSGIDKKLLLNKIYSNNFVKEIIDLWESGKSYKDIGEAVGLFRNTVKKIIKNASYGGLTFYDRDIEIKKNQKRIGLFNAKKVKCINDSLEYESATCASNHYDINVQSICNCARGKTKKCRGKNGERLVFKYV